MTFKAELTMHPVQTAVATRRGLLAGGAVILAASDAGAPREPEPRHGVHMTETGFVKVAVDEQGDAAMVGYGAFWALWQHEDLTYHHPNGGHAKFLELAFLAEGETALGVVAQHIAAELAAGE